jgi:hypothetical protein
MEPQTQEALVGIFENYVNCSGRFAQTATEPGIDSARFLKFCKDSNLIQSSTFRMEEVDLLFTKHKEPNQRHITFRGFCGALQYIAGKRGTTLQGLATFILKTSPGAPLQTATTTALAVPLHDDPRTYTGVYKAGGPTIVDKAHLGLDHLVSRGIVPGNNKLAATGGVAQPTTVLERMSGPGAPVQGGGAIDSRRGSSGRVSEPVDPSYSFGHPANVPLPRSYSDEVRNIFDEFCSKSSSGGQQPVGVDSARFAKFCRESKIFDASFRVEDLDIVFSKYKEPGQRVLSLHGFLSALGEIAGRKQVTTEVLVQYIVAQKPSAQPHNNTTVALAVPLHDQQELYTGVYKAGGPTVVDKSHLGLDHQVSRGIVPVSKERPAQPSMPPPPPPSREAALSAQFSQLNMQQGAVLAQARSVSMPPPQLQQMPAAQHAYMMQSMPPMPPPPQSYSTPSYQQLYQQHQPQQQPQYQQPQYQQQQHQHQHQQQSQRFVTPTNPAGGSGGMAMALSNTFLDIFNAYAAASSLSSGPRDVIDSSRFAKFCKDSKLLDMSFRREDIDVVFTTYKEPNQRVMTLQGLMDALTYVALKKGVSVEVLLQYIIAQDPASQIGNTNVTAAVPTPLHDQQDNYTGVYRAGGPTFVDRNKLGLEDHVRKA